jgi:hypothetical protein
MRGNLVESGVGVWLRGTPHPGLVIGCLGFPPGQASAAPRGAVVVRVAFSE